MLERLSEIAPPLRQETGAAIRQRRAALTDAINRLLVGELRLDAQSSHHFSGVLLNLMATAVEEGGIHHLGQGVPPLPLRQLIRAIQRIEESVLDELARHQRLGASSERWPVVAYSVRAASFEMIAALIERDGGSTAGRDSLTTLLAPHVFALALAQETQRALRHEHGISVILFDIDDLSHVNRLHGYGAGDRLLERLGILAGQFFRTHDWVARYEGDSIAVILPETTLDQASALAQLFRETVEQRLILIEHKSDSRTTVTVSAAAVGTDIVQSEIDPHYIVAEAQAAVMRAKMDGGNRVERVALLPTSFTIIGASAILGTTSREIIRLIRTGVLRAVRRGRHYHIDRSQIEELRAKRV